MISLDDALKACPSCLQSWSRFDHDLYYCKICKMDLFVNPNGWLRKGFDTNYNDSKISSNCVFWEIKNKNMVYHDQNSRVHWLQVDLPFDITQQQLQTLINFQ